MKKVLVSLVVILGFVSYSIYQRIYGVNVMPVISPVNQNNISTPTDTPVPTSTPAVSGSNNSGLPPTFTPSPAPTSGYKDGSYTGDVADAIYGNIQVQATISNGKITNIQFLQYPNDRDTSVMINQQADPMLAQEAIQSQSANVDIVSGATDSSQAFIQSLQSALDKAKI